MQATYFAYFGSPETVGTGSVGASEVGPLEGRVDGAAASVSDAEGDSDAEGEVDDRRWCSLSWGTTPAMTTTATTDAATAAAATLGRRGLG
jgi:hypothetical protein